MLLSLSLSSKHTPLEIRERFSTLPEELPEVGRALHPHLSEVLLISTCQRFEAYAVPRQQMVGECLVGLLAQYRGVDLAQVTPHVQVHHDRAAAEHLFRLAAGMESQVLGEAQILGQIRRSLDAARTTGLIGHQLDRLVQHGLSAGRRVREQTVLGRGALSVSRLAVDEARAAIGDLAERTVLLVGAGETAQLAASALDRVGRLLIVNRTLARAEALACAQQAEAMPWAALPAAVAIADLIFCCASTQEPPLSRSLLATTQRRRAGRPQLVVDLSVPRGVEPSATGLPGLHLITLDDLHEQSTAHLAERLQALPSAERIIAEEVERAWQIWTASSANPAIVALRQRAEEIRRGELDRAGSRLGTLLPEQDQAIEYLTRAIVQKLLHQPTVWLRANPGLADTALRDLFGVGVRS